MNAPKSPRTTLLAVGLIALLVLAGAALVFAASRGGGAEAEAPADSSHAGHEATPEGMAAADLDGDGVVYQSGMHPWIVRDEPGKCPICGMDLLPVNLSGAEAGTVAIDPVTLQNIGVRMAPVQVQALQRTVRTTGRFEANEQQTAVVSPKVDGWIEKLHVNYEGARVAAGTPLLEIYSPELVSTQEEYLLALRNFERLSGTAAEEDGRRLVEAARRRLAYWDISQEQILRLEETKTPQKTLTLYSPAGGTVEETIAVLGKRVVAGETLMQIANLSSLWLQVDVYEKDLAWVGHGTRASIELPYDPGIRLQGVISYVYDDLDPEMRTVRARVAVPNPGQRLKPGMYATVTLIGGETEPTPVVPSEALIRGGEADLVILSLGGGRFRPAPVVAGAESEGLVQILSGLEGSEQVVTSAQFLIDSEARLASAVGAMEREHVH